MPRARWGRVHHTRVAHGFARAVDIRRTTVTLEAEHGSARSTSLCHRALCRRSGSQSPNHMTLTRSRRLYRYLHTRGTRWTWLTPTRHARLTPHTHNTPWVDPVLSWCACNQAGQRYSRGRQIRACPAMSASLIGHSGSSAFRLFTTTVSMSLTGSCFSTESAPRPFHHGIRRRGGTIFRAALSSV